MGAWLKPLRDSLRDEIESLDEAIKALGLSPEAGAVTTKNPLVDTRFEALCGLMSSGLCDAMGAFLPEERLVVFTEYKTTLDYLERRLAERFPAAGAIRVLFGGMDDAERDEIKAAFNDPADPVRILVATDAAAEGLNLQETARYLLHYDIPWNPARLEQRNGRLDRHGQARDVVIHHFTSDDDADLQFLAYVIGKVNTIREDLGVMGDVFERAFERRLILGEAVGIVRSELEARVAAAPGRTELPRERAVETGEEELAKLEALSEELDLDAEALRHTLDVAMSGPGYPPPRLEGPDDAMRYRLSDPIPPAWQPVVEQELHGRDLSGLKGARRRVLFDPSGFLRTTGARAVFRPRKDTVLLHLGSPVFHQVLNRFARARFPGETAETATRWTVRRDHLPEGTDALLVLTVEEMAVNELRETFHHWVRTYRMPVRAASLGEPLLHLPARRLRPAGMASPGPDEIRDARLLWEEIERDMADFLKAHARELTGRLHELLEQERSAAIQRENERFRSRQGEVSAMIANSTVKSLEREIEHLKTRKAQGDLYEPANRIEELDRSIEEKQAEIRRRISHFEELRAQLQVERERVIDRIIPGRYALRGSALVFPVAIEIRLPMREVAF